MTETAYHLNPSVQLLRTEDNRYLVLHQNRHFSVGDLLFMILEGIRDQQPPEAISERLRCEKKVNLSGAEVSQLIQEKLGVFLNTPSEQSEQSQSNAPKGRYVYAKVTLLPEKYALAVGQSLAWLFRPAVMRLLMPLCAIMTLVFNLHAVYEGNYTRTFLAVDTVSLYVFGYVLIALLMLFHEIGHSAATASFGVSPKDIGFGLYLVFPVFYTDVSRIWILNKTQRIIVNLGGIYFQWLVNLLFIALYLLTPASNEEWLTFWRIAICFNSIISLYALNPFFRNDGYWVFSDFFEVPNLSSQSYRYPFRLLAPVFSKTQKSNIVQEVRKNWPVLLHSIGYYVLWGTGTYFVGKYCFTSVQAVQKIVNTFEYGGLEGAIPIYGIHYLVKTGFFLFLVAIFLGRVLIIYVPKWVQQLSRRLPRRQLA